jgi:hypothetical protein
MSEKIHPTLADARRACEEYEKERLELQERKGVDDVCEDSCANMSVTARYQDADGAVRTYYL